MYLDRFNLKGRVAVVTGGAQGIGLAWQDQPVDVRRLDRRHADGAYGRAG